MVPHPPTPFIDLLYCPACGTLLLPGAHKTAGAGLYCANDQCPRSVPLADLQLVNYLDARAGWNQKP